MTFYQSHAPLSTEFELVWDVSEMMRRLKWVPIASFFILWLLSFDLESWKWCLISTLVFLTPLFSIRSVLLFRFTSWVALLMSVQLVCGYSYIKPYHHLTPRLSISLEVKGLRGVDGIQKISTDEKGFRVLPPFNYSNFNQVRILALGASTTEQIYLSDEKTWTAGLERILGEKVKVINAGVSGLSIPRIYENLRYARTLKPDLVLVFVGVNDWMLQVRREFEGDLSLRQKAKLMQRDLGLETLQLKHSPLVQLGYLLREGLRKTPHHTKDSQVVYGERLQQKKNSLQRPIRFKYRPEAPSHEFQDYLERIMRECEKEKLKCYFLTQPYGYSQNRSKDYLASLWMTPADTAYTLDLESVIYLGKLYNNFIRRVAQDHQMPICELENRVSGGFESFYDDVHFNLSGAEEVGKLISECIALEFKSHPK